ncbi:MAG: ABC transporter ATP-binding protein, partial [Acidimicrobiales bacterium]|nr:ABC transporter ATP-binding protein [Acidimicrobiales bacterium]
MVILKEAQSAKDTSQKSIEDRKSGWIKGLLPFLKPHRKSLIVAFGSAGLGMIVNSLTPLIQRQIVNNLTYRHSLSGLDIWIGLLLGSGVLAFGFSYLRRFVGGKVSLDVQNDLRNAIFSHLQRLDFAVHDELATGQIVSRANSDIGILQGLLGFMPMMTSNLLSLLVSLVIMAILSPILTLVALVAVPLMFVVALKLRTTVFPATWMAQQYQGVLAGVVDDSVTGVRVVKAFAAEDRELKRLEATALDLYKNRVRVVKVTAKMQSILQAIPALAQVGVLALGGWLALKGSISLGTFLAFTTYVLQMIAPVRMLAGLMAVGQQARAGAERILDLLSSNPVVKERLDAIDIGQVRGDVVFENVNFGYLSKEPVLKDFSLHIAQGETVALVGTSGSGKSTISLLLPRFYDIQSGKITIDGADIRDLKLNSLRDQIGIVFEDSFLFSDTISSNISYGKENATTGEIIQAAKAAEAHGFIEKLPEGYDTIVGERGLTLSGGQRQRVALARALISNPKILILDDATSAIDAATEEEIHSTLRKIMSGRTTLLIAHRKSTIHLADRIVVIDKGQVCAEGTLDDLLDNSILFRELMEGSDDINFDEDEESLSQFDSSKFLNGDSETTAREENFTPSLWQEIESDDFMAQINRASQSGKSNTAPGLGMGLGG